MKDHMKSKKLRYVVIVLILVLCFGAGLILRLPSMTQVSPEDVKITGAELDKKGTLTFEAEVQESDWFDYSGMEYDARWIEDERGQKEKVIVCCIYKHFKIGGTDNEKKKFLFKVPDLSEMRDVSTVYFGRSSDRIRVWEQKNL